MYNLGMIRRMHFPLSNGYAIIGAFLLNAGKTNFYQKNENI